jgi:hypothetical protein
MGQSLEIELGGKTTVPEAVDKSKKAIKSFAEQVADIKKKFGESFKDIFLSFLGPMALIGAVMGFIGKLIADNQKKQEDANKAAIEGTNKLMSAEDRYWANKRNNSDKDKATTEEANSVRQQVTEQFLREDKRGEAVIKANQLHVMDPRRGIVDLPSFLSSNKVVQAQVQAIIAEDMKKNPLPGTNVPSFKGPEGFSNVVGVGANPVIEAMTRQVEIQDEILKIIKEAMPPSRPLDVPDFTKKVPLILQKAGIA